MNKGKKEINAIKINGLVGHYFLNFKHNETGRKVVHQGRIIEKIRDDYYLVELYSWVTGAPTCRMLYPVHAISLGGFELYEEQDDFIEAGTAEFRKLRGEEYADFRGDMNA